MVIPSLSAGADPYCIVKCGRSKAETPVKTNTLNPNFSASVQFFVSNPGSAEVTVEVSNSVAQYTYLYEESLMYVMHDVCRRSDVMLQYNVVSTYHVPANKEHYSIFLTTHTCT